MVCMKNNILLHSFFIIGSLICLSSCKEDVGYDIYGMEGNRIFINEGVAGGVRNALGTLNVMRTPVSVDVAEKQIAFPVRCSSVADEDIRVTLQMGDKSLIDAYNQEKGTDYRFIGNDLNVLLGVLESKDAKGSGVINTSISTLTIPAGSYMSKDSIALSIPKEEYAKLDDGIYLLPIQISDISGNAFLSEKRPLTISYVIINVTTNTNMVEQVESVNKIAGTKITDRTSWKVSVETTATMEDTTRDLLDGSTGTMHYSKDLGARIKWILDLGCLENVSGIVLSAYRNSWVAGAYTRPEAITLFYSVDGVSYQKMAEFSIYKYETANDQYYAAYTPFSARYIAIDVQSWDQNGWYAGFSEFNVYVEQ